MEACVKIHRDVKRREKDEGGRNVEKVYRTCLFSLSVDFFFLFSSFSFLGRGVVGPFAIVRDKRIVCRQAEREKGVRAA